MNHFYLLFFFIIFNYYYLLFLFIFLFIIYYLLLKIENKIINSNNFKNLTTFAGTGTQGNESFIIFIYYFYESFLFIISIYYF
jgi:hypothetical protein